MAVSFEIRDGRLHISGYVNAVERDSLPIMTARGKCVEQIRAGAFAQSMADGHEIRLRYNHKRDIGSTSDGALTLREDNIGLYAEAVTDDEEVVTLAGKGELRGWSFGFVAKDDEVEERQNNIPRRHINALELREVSILSVQPAYNGTSLEYRDADGVELRAYDVYEDESAEVEVHRVNGEIKAIVETEREHSEQPSDDGNTMTDTMKRTEVSAEGIRTETVTEEHTWQRDNAALNAQIERMKMQGILMKLQAERKEIEDRAFRSELAYRKAKMDESKAELEERYNHYHDPRTGQFASGKGGGTGLYYSMGKGKGEIVGASSKWNSPKVQTAAESEQVKEDIIESIRIEGIKKKAQNGEGNWDWVNGTPVSESEALSMEVDKVLEKGDGYTVVVGRVGNNFSYFATKDKDNLAVKRAKEKQAEKATKRKERADELQQDSIATQGKDKMTTSTGDRWLKKHRKDFDDWYFGSKGG